MQRCDEHWAVEVEVIRELFYPLLKEGEEYAE